MRPSVFTETFTAKSQSGVDSGGDPTFGSAFTFKGRHQPGRDRSETEIDHADVVYSDTELRIDDRVWFPGDDTTDDTVARRPVSVTPARHPGGTTVFWKVLF